MATTIQPEVAYLAIAGGNVETALTIPSGVKGLRIQCRAAADVRVSAIQGEVVKTVTPRYWTIKSGTIWESMINAIAPNDAVTPPVLYFEAAAAQTLEIEFWY